MTSIDVEEHAETAEPHADLDALQAKLVLLMAGHNKRRSPDELIREGVPLEALDRLAALGVNVVDLGIIKPRTLTHRRSRGQALSTEEGDRLYRAGKMLLLAEEQLEQLRHGFAA
ncbi:antitoxin Xre-like helix-turn-helix domain-containing protein [Halomonas daqiaonensis]|uniref:Antitoxin Xre-like helix-turn-helix domain-containing protein n=1 Tax=Halomonas daqiaonensis TaxID=650850 RepID=A0A1H7TFZ2_9GAMM|nr:antitoxin Xre-like helix-turn-helix domain-containing protein [Halomonas daqiaonensis]SEL83802.1 hypothetical protein SAMN04488129_11744 [Halomonas daqiaonensis]